MDNQKLYSAAIVGGFVSAMMFSIPFLNLVNCFCCIGIMTGGAIGLLYYYQSFENKEYISPANAITIGLAVGISGAFISVFITWLVYLIFGNWEVEFLQNMSNTMAEIPEMTEMFEETLSELEQQSARGMRVGILLMELIRNLIILPIFATAGSLITRVFINKKIQDII